MRRRIGRCGFAEYKESLYCARMGACSSYALPCARCGMVCTPLVVLLCRMQVMFACSAMQTFGIAEHASRNPASSY